MRGRFYRPELDGLRFFAFLAVYINHTLSFGDETQHHHLPARFANALGTAGIAGAFGVDLFFVLSAFLITELLLREHTLRGSLAIGNFYIRRILRIWPLYFLFLAFAYALTFFVPTEQMRWYHLAGFLLFSGNWIYALHPATTVAAPLWSISVEEQFYLVWPWAVRKGSAERIVALALGIIATGMMLRFALSEAHIHGEWITKNSFTRIDGIAAGALLCVALRNRAQPITEAARPWLLGGGLLLLLVVAHSFHLFHANASTDRVVFGWPLVALACCGIVAAIIDGRGALTRLLSNRVLVYLGRLSYGLYVFHELGLLIADSVFTRYNSTMVGFIAHWSSGLLLTFAFAALSYRCIEQPFLRLKERRFTVVASRPESAPADSPA
jgi:peptidoglycan/LPS O-acetylase OafA/YrhL